MSVEVHPQYVVDESGERRSVLLSIEEFESLIAFIDEDDADLIEDAAALDRAVDTEKDFKPWRQMRDNA
jgi:hypothetical protein